MTSSATAQIPAGLIPSWQGVDESKEPPKVINTPYHWGGLAYPRVSDILKVWHQPELESWMRSLAVEDALVQAPPEDDRFQDAKRMALAAPFRIRDRAAAVGTRIHKGVEQFLEGQEPDEIDHPEAGPFIRSACEFIERYVAGVVAFERSLYNASFHYAGTGDLFAELIDGRIACIDWKSGNRVHRTHALQLAAYVNAEWSALEPDGDRLEVPQADVGWVVHVRPDLDYPHGYGVYEVPKPRGRPWKAFVACRTLYEQNLTEKQHMGRIL